MERPDMMVKMETIVTQTRKENDRDNSSMPIHGQRIEIPLTGRTLPAAFYPAPVENAPMLFAFHGGGFCFGGCCIDDLMYAELRDRLQVNVVSVGYRKAVFYPASLDDCYESILYFIRNLEFSFNRNFIMTFGSSAGANLAAAVSLRAYRTGEFSVALRILNYPFLDLATPPQEKPYTKEDDIPMNSYFSYVYAAPELRTDPLISPVYAGKEDLDPKTATLISMAEIDSFRAEDERFAEKLKGFGCPVECYVAAGMMHGYFEFGCRETVGWCSPEIKAGLEDGSIRKACRENMNQIETFYRRYKEIYL